jgi:hypothetical protein
MKLRGHSKEFVVNLKDTAKIVPLHFPVDVELPKTI